MSYAFKMTDITLEGVSLVEDIHRKRQPFPFIDAIYFIQPSRDNIAILLSDMSGETPLYRRAYVFFSSPVPVGLVNYIQKDFPRIKMKEMDLEYFAIESQSFITGNERVLEDLFGVEESTCQGDSNLSMMASRIATVFASLREFPSVRYRAAKSIDATTPTTLSDLIPTKLAARVWNYLMRYKDTMPKISPVIHEWFYDAMCHDLRNMEGSKYVQEVLGKDGDSLEKKEVILDEHDRIWLELRHAHIAEVNDRLHEKMTTFITQHKATQHIGMKDVMKFLKMNENATHENKLRLLMITAAIYPEEFDGEKGLNLMKLAKLTAEDMNAVNNMKSFSGIFSLNFDFRKELIEKLAKGELSKKEYPCLNEPSTSFCGSSPISGLHQASARSMRTRPPTWAHHRNSTSDSVPKHGSNDFQKMGQRIFVFIVGGATRSELRVCHKLTNKLKREVVLGSSSLDDPSHFVSKMKQLMVHDGVSPDNL
ncbi:Sec1-like protein [Corchorus olitorius]|uniref:Sec1-like protein n=1 Tax=Corchorus olitorius TaxID=93759 RepID=A0A1R3HE71_9ROSI|nr:Sec1-like protein [Corchorus olitorius]